MLTNAAVRAARPRPRAYKLADAGGLYLHVAPTGNRSFRLRFRDQKGHEQTLTFGLWPAISLDEARGRRDRARAQLARGEDPRVAPIDTFAAAARAWHAHRAPGWSTVHAGDVLASLERDVFPAIGADRLDAIERPRVLALLERVEARGAVETARRLRQRIEMIYAFARAKGWTRADNPAEVGEALAHSPGRGRQAALVDVDALRALVAAVAALDAAPILRLASRFLALTAVRLAALRGMRWDEVDGLDTSTPTWRIPAARMKLGVAAKSDAAHDHLVPLSRAAAGVLRAARALASDHIADAGRLIFPGRDGVSPIGAGALGELYARAGAGGCHVPHGWRASFSTVMNERHPDQRVAIDRALAHQPKGMSKVEAAYNRAQHLDRRRSLFEEWAELLTPAAE